MEECYFKLMGRCNSSDKHLTCAGYDRIQSIISASQQRGDILPTELNDIGKDYKIYCHRSCVSSYTSKHKIEKFLKSEKKCHQPSPRKRSRRSSVDDDFNFKSHCLFCGELCPEERDPKHPDRWRPMSRCRTVDSGPSGKTHKETILEVCKERKDKWGKEVELRLLGCLSDLHAADARYHRDCRPSFMSSKTQKSNDSRSQVDAALDEVIRIMESDRSKFWSSVELYKLYIDCNGEDIHRRSFVNTLLSHFGDQLLLFSCKGLASMLVFKERASELVQLVEDTDIDCASMKTVAKQIIHEAKTLQRDTLTYDTSVNADIARSQCSETLLALLSYISPKLGDSLTSLLIGNMITNAVTKKPTTLQIALGVAAREKDLINLLYDFSVTCSYYEVLRFKTSAAHNAANMSVVNGLFNAEEGLIQAVIDNYDANISSLNGLKSTHALAMLMCQSNSPANTVNFAEDDRIPRISKTDMKLSITEAVPIHQYYGPKRPDMPAFPAPPDLTQHEHLMHSQNVSVARALELDLQFLKSITLNDKACEYGGHITQIAREQNHSVKPATQTRYRPLIDHKPSDPSTIKSAMIEAQSLTLKCGQQFVVITADQQLYKVILDNIWAAPEVFSDVYPRLGGLHIIMSFCGCIGKLMVDSGLSDILKHAFGGVEKLLSGKKYPQNVRAFRLLTEELLRKFIPGIHSAEDLLQFLTDVSAQSQTSKLWSDCFIRPTLILMVFIRAERESDWPLHLWAMTQMMPYFFASAHVNYARYGLHYLRSMESLPPDIYQMFQQGQHTMRHTAGVANSTWSDMFIESTFMRYGHSQGGLTGITLNNNATQRWALSLHACSLLLHDLDVMRDDIPTHVSHHKEESAGRISADVADREKLKEKLTQCVHPLDPTGHPQPLFNIVSGQLADITTNVHNSVELGQGCMDAYESKLPQGFYDRISSPVTTMATKRKCVKVGTETIVDTEVIFNRTLGIMDSVDFSLEYLFAHELAPIPTSLFTDEGGLRPATSKSKLMKTLAIEKSCRTLPKPDVILLDGCAILWKVHWPLSGTVEDLVQAVARYVRDKLSTSDVYLTFDRYFPYSTKGYTRDRRSCATSMYALHLKPQSPLPPQSASLTVVDNKVQIIAIICDRLIEVFQQDISCRRLTITGADPVPNEVHNGIHTKREDLAVHHEEADVILTNQVIHEARQGTQTIHVVSDDTDVFVLLVHFYLSLGLNIGVYMVPTNMTRTGMDIGETAAKHRDIGSSLLSLHALTGCDTVSTLYGIGKVKSVKVLQKGIHPPDLGDLNGDVNSMILKSVHFIAACYGSKAHDAMSEVRYSVWRTKTSKSKSKSFKLASLPPTSEAFTLHVKRAHFQVSLWKAAPEPSPPPINPCDYGWLADQSTQTLLPVPLPADTGPAPEQVLSLLCCNCTSLEACATKRCSCRKAEIMCSTFCKCCIDSSVQCANPLSKFVMNEFDSDDETNLVLGDSDDDFDL